jgi:hypothetical protein
MKELIIKYSDSKILDVLRSLATYLGFSISEKQEQTDPQKKNVTFNAIKLDTRSYKFNRDEANER